MKILLAEDDHITASILVKILEKEGFDPDWYQDGQMAFNWFKQNPYSVVLSDWMMPGMDGISLCRAIRQLRLPNFTYFILLTAKISQSEGCKVLASGVDAFLPKPLVRSELKAKLNVARSLISSQQERNAA